MDVAYHRDWTLVDNRDCWEHQVNLCFGWKFVVVVANTTSLTNPYAKIPLQGGPTNETTQSILPMSNLPNTVTTPGQITQATSSLLSPTTVNNTPTTANTLPIPASTRVYLAQNAQIGAGMMSTYQLFQPFKKVVSMILLSAMPII